jgi:glycerate dehydrogenase
MHSPLRSVFLDRDSVDRGDLDFSSLDRVLPELDSWGSTPREQVIERIGDAQVVITNKVVLDAETLDTCTRLELVVVAATGINNVDIDAARRNGVTVCNVRDYATSSVSQHVFALILSLARNIGPYASAARAGRWGESPFFCLLDYPIVDLEGQTLGIIGHGVLGSAVARLGMAFGMRILKGARPGQSDTGDRVALRTLYHEADVISLHCPLTEQTRHLIDHDALAEMKSDAILINTARGGIVDEQALFEALRDNGIGGAGIDVLAIEPPDGSSPLLGNALPNLIVTPHNAWASRRCRQALIGQIANNVSTWLSGTPANRVT